MRKVWLFVLKPIVLYVSCLGKVLKLIRRTVLSGLDRILSVPGSIRARRGAAVPCLT